MKKIFGQTKFLVKKNLDKIVFGNKIISVKKIFWLKKIWVKKNLGKEISVKTIFQKKSFGKKNLV